MSVLLSAIQPVASLPRHPRFVDASNSRKERDGSAHRGHPRNRRCSRTNGTLASFRGGTSTERCTSINCTPEDTRARRPFFCEGPFFRTSSGTTFEESIGVLLPFLPLFFSSARVRGNSKRPTTAMAQIQ